MENEFRKLIRGKAQRILFVGIGNVFRNDDGIGVYIVQRIRESCRFMKMTVEVSLENYLSKINKLNPDLVILVDCIDFGRIPGFTAILPIELTDGPGMQSHHLSLSKLGEFISVPVRVLGIQPANLSVGENLSPGVQKAGDRIVAIIEEGNRPEERRKEFTNN